MRNHMGRIAWLVENPDRTPIDVEVDINGEWTLVDGNHRVAAAWFRGDRSIRVDRFGFLPS